MDTYQLLRSKARDRRDLAIYLARAEYKKTVREIDQLLRSLGEPGSNGPRVNALRLKLCDANESLRGMTTIKAAETVLRESQPLTLVEIIIAMQSRGCRPYDDPRKLAKTVRSSFYYHRERFRQDTEKRWSVID